MSADVNLRGLKCSRYDQSFSHAEQLLSIVEVFSEASLTWNA